MLLSSNSTGKIKFALFTLVLALMIWQLVIVCLNHFFYRTYALDYAIYNFAFFDFAHARLSPVPAYIYPFPSTFLQDHFSLTLPVLAPLYWIVNPIFGTYSLLIIQWVFICVGAWSTFKFVLHKSDNSILSYLAVLLYFCLFGRYSAYLNDVNLAIIGSSLIPTFFYFFETRQTAKTYALLLMLLLNREDYALWLMFIAFFLLVVNRKHQQKRRVALTIGLLSIVYFILVMSVIIPAFEDEQRKYNLFDFSVVGNSPLQALLFIVKHPIESIKLLVINHNGDTWHDGRKSEFYIVYFLSGGFLLLSRPVFFIPFIPILLKKMYDDNPLRWSIEGYYSIEFVSIMPLFIFWILSDYKRVNTAQILAISVVLLATIVTVWKIETMPHNALVGQSNKYNFTTAGFYKADVNRYEIKLVMSAIPDTASVCASGRLMAHLANREKIYYFPRYNGADYIAVLKKNDFWPLYDYEFFAALDSIKKDNNWELTKDLNDVVLFTRKKNYSKNGGD